MKRPGLNFPALNLVFVVTAALLLGGCSSLSDKDDAAGIARVAAVHAAILDPRGTWDRSMSIPLPPANAISAAATASPPSLKS